MGGQPSLMSPARGLQKGDPASQSNFEDVCTRHLHFDWTIDWTQQIVSGYVVHDLDTIAAHIKVISLDTSYLEIQACYLNDRSVGFTIHPRHPVMGSRLDIDADLRKGDPAKLKIEYATTAKCTTLGWLTKEQTSDRTHPFLYSQSQAIHARSLFPCQDTPAVKITYTATVRSALEGCALLMSARRVSPVRTERHIPAMTEFKYSQPIPIPSYLVAIAGGNLIYTPLGQRSGVWAEPSVAKDAAWEFADTERFMDAAEKLICPYVWGDYDMLVLPASFPFGGMENSNLTFLTPTLLAGDRSLVDVVAHELSHSWFGNLVSCYSWSNFWSNESFTTYCERLILRELHGEPTRQFSYIIGAKSLASSLAEFKNRPKYQRLHIDYEAGEDPDDAFSTVPYDKGANMLLYLEGIVGGLQVWLPYVRNYVETFKHKSLTTSQWKEHLFQFFASDAKVTSILNQVDWDAWLYGEGLSLPVDMKYDTSLADAAYSLARRWDKARDGSHDGFSARDLKEFDSNQVVVFLEALESLPAFESQIVDSLNDKYGFDSTKSTEIRLRWYEIALKPESGAKFKESAAIWVADKGRMKFCRVVYRLLFGVDQALARKTFEKNKAFYHPIAAAMIRKDLKLSN